LHILGLHIARNQIYSSRGLHYLTLHLTLANVAFIGHEIYFSVGAHDLFM